uniref:Uncharacterized protein n=1 Tax=Zea mays TaxID=4577 RepID=A0A804PBS0_MAIZE
RGDGRTGVRGGAPSRGGRGTRAGEGAPNHGRGRGVVVGGVRGGLGEGRGRGRGGVRVGAPRPGGRGVGEGARSGCGGRGRGVGRGAMSTTPAMIMPRARTSDTVIERWYSNERAVNAMLLEREARRVVE